MRHHDLVFLKHFSQVIAILVGIFIALVMLGMYLNSLKPVEPNRHAIAAMHERIQPLGAVYAGATGAAAQAAAAAEAAKGVPAWHDGTMDGAEIFGGVCTNCHTAGVLGAPTLTHANWAPRIAKGVDVLHDHAIHGFNQMPAKGGEHTLSDDQVKATVDWMIKNLK